MLASLSASLPAFASISVDLSNESTTIDFIQDDFKLPAPVFSLDHSTLNVTRGGDKNNSFLLYGRTVSATNGSELNVGSTAEWHGGEYSFIDSKLNVNGYLRLCTLSSTEKAGSMNLQNSEALISGNVELNAGAVLTLSGKSSLVANGALTMASGEYGTSLREVSILNLNGKDVLFSVKSVNINNTGAGYPNSKLNVDGASFVVQENASFAGADIDLRGGASIKAGSFSSSNNSSLRMEQGTSIETEGSLAINTQDSSMGGFIADGISLTSKNGKIQLANIDGDRMQLTNSTLTAKTIELIAWARAGASSSDFSSVAMTADSFVVQGNSSSSIRISGTSVANFSSSDINERGRLIIAEGASVNLGNITVGSNTYGSEWPEGDSGHLVIDGNAGVLAGKENVVGYASTLTVQNGGKMIMGDADVGAGGGVPSLSPPVRV